MMNFRNYLQKIEEYATGDVGNIPGVHNDGPGSGFNSGGGLVIQPSSNGGGKGFEPSHWADTENIQRGTAFLDGFVRKAMDKMDVNQGRLPLIRRDTRVMYARKEENPIYVHLEDGTRLFFTRGEWQRAGKPDVGKRVSLVLQRRMDDTSDKPSQVHSIRAY